MEDFQYEWKNENKNLREEMLEQMQGLGQEVSQQMQELREFSQRAAVFEVETSDKVAVLFDAYTINNEKHAMYEEAITSLNAKMFNHQIRIEKLEGTIKAV